MKKEKKRKPELAIQAKCLQRSVNKMWSTFYLWVGDPNIVEHLFYEKSKI